MIGKNKILFLLVWLAGSVLAVEPLVVDTIFVAFDTETTGFSMKKDRLVELGAVKFRGDGEVLSVTNWLVNPQREIPFYATSVHGISTEMVIDAPVFAAIWPEFEAFCDGAMLCAHNAPFDIGFLRKELRLAGIDPPPLPVIDTLPLFRDWFPNAFSHSLEKLSVYLGIEGAGYHRAEADSLYILKILTIGMRQRSALTLQQLEQEANGVNWLDGKKR